MGKIILNGTGYGGSGGSSGGHTIVDPTGTDMPQENKLQFTGAVNVSDDSANGQTVVDVEGGGGNVYGAFVDTDRVITSGTYNTSLTYTATEDCFVTVEWVSPQNDSAYFFIDGERAFTNYASSSIDAGTITLPLKKGQVLTGTTAYNSTKSYKVYGVVQGTNGIFAPVIYSDTERVIGVWRDNKPLYQRTYDLGSEVSVSNSSWQSTGIDISNVEMIPKCGALSADGSYQSDLLAGKGGGTDLLIQTPRNSTGYVRYLILQYTKTTDVAGSGNWNTDGVPTHHYSTNEQVIGTWIDGKPLYECIVDGLSLAVNMSWSSEVATNLNIKYLVNATLYDNSNPNNSVVVNVEQVQVLNGGFRISHSTNSSGRTITRAVIQYTKTTD